MQTVSRYLLNNVVIVYQNGYHGRNSKVYDRRLTLHRGVINPLTFTFKNEDQKAQDVSSKTVASGNYYQLLVVDTESKKAVITKNLTILDDGDLLPLDAKFYEYAIQEVKSDGSTLVTYSDTSYVAGGTIEILDTAYPQFTASTNVTSFTASGGPLAKTTGNINGKPGLNNNTALHSIAVYTQDFSGTLMIQATLSTDPGSNDYFNITPTGESTNELRFSSSSTVTNFNFTGVYQFVRFSWGNDTGNTGKIDKILYRQ